KEEGKKDETKKEEPAKDEAKKDEAKKEAPVPEQYKPFETVKAEVEEKWKADTVLQGSAVNAALIPIHTDFVEALKKHNEEEEKKTDPAQRVPFDVDA